MTKNKSLLRLVWEAPLAAIVGLGLSMVSVHIWDHFHQPMLTILPSNPIVESKKLQPMIATIYLKNSGTSDLNIKDILTGCSCEIDFVGSRIIPPKATRTLHVKVSPNGLQHFEKTVFVQTNERGIREHTITIDANFPEDRTMKLAMSHGAGN